MVFEYQDRRMIVENEPEVEFLGCLSSLYPLWQIFVVSLVLLDHQQKRYEDESFPDRP